MRAVYLRRPGQMQAPLSAPVVVDPRVVQASSLSVDVLTSQGLDFSSRL
jgi:hypothetical protein